MSLKQEIETWVKALNHYDNNEFDEALGAFDQVSDTSKILFNMGVIHATLGEHERAVDCYVRAIKLDQYLAVAYFQQGVSNFLMGDFEEALANFNDTLMYLRGNNNIDYEQLGLKFKLYACEVLFNRGLCYIYLQQLDQGMQDLTFAAKEKAVPDHEVIEEAINEQAEGYTVFSIPVGVVYRPNDAKVKNLKAKDYLGKARLVAATDRSQTFTGFTGAEIKKMNTSDAAKDDRPEEKISFAASNLVKTDIKSRYRQQSEPPLNRNVFPPTPPPESDKPQEQDKPKVLSRAETVKAGPKPRPLDLAVAGFDRRESGNSSRSGDARPRRTESERPSGSRSQRGSRDNMALSQRRGSERNSGGRPKRSPTDDPAYPEEVYDMYGRQSVAGATGRRDTRQQRQQMYIEEEDEEEEDDYSASYDEADFEMVSGKSAAPRRSGTRRSVPEVRKIRVKVHADDTRYVMVGPAVEFLDFIDQVRTKFGLRQSFKVKIKDEQDMITMADQDDLDLAIETAKASARRERSDMAKMEVWIQAV